MIKLRNILLGFSLLLIIVSCETTERIDDFPLRPSKLVLNSFFTADSAWTFQLSKSLSVLDNADIKLVKNGIINIYQDNNLIETIDVQDSDQWYRSGLTTPQMGTEYNIEVSAPGFGSTLRSKSYVPIPVDINMVEAKVDSGDIVIEYGYSYGYHQIKMKITFADPITEDNYYQLSIVSVDTSEYYSNDELIREAYYHSYYLRSNDPSISDELGYNSDLLFSDEFFNGKNYTLDLEFQESNYLPDKNYIIRLFSITEDCYKYYNTILTYRSSSNDPFSEPVEIFSNVENGFGIFTGFSFSEFQYHLK